MDRKSACIAVLASSAILAGISGIPGVADTELVTEGVDVSEQRASAEGAAADLFMAALATDTEACKPSAPVKVTVTTEASGPDPSQLDVEFTIEPLVTFTSLTWSASCEGGATQVGGSNAGTVSDVDGAMTARLAVTPGQDAAFVIRVRGELADGEVVALRRTLRWGDGLDIARVSTVPSEELTPSMTLPTRSGR